MTLPPGSHTGDSRPGPLALCSVPPRVELISRQGRHRCPVGSRLPAAQALGRCGHRCTARPVRLAPQVSPRIGLPRLPVVEWPAPSSDEGPRGLHWKTRPLVEWADGRPFIRVDDEINTMDRLWVDASHSGPSLLHRVDPVKGLVEADLSVPADWTRAVTPG
ncbi:hypothetical protein [Streptomyces sp. NRRL B-3648]|uniref:hypothetical protein n=1 Tax=Streptomyces sp. NRRL B-3648 TaxID=1519493 RepID=UPI003B634FCF